MYYLRLIIREHEQIDHITRAKLSIVREIVELQL